MNTDALSIEIACVSNLYSRMMLFEKCGAMEQGHSHPFDHVTLLAKGKLEITVEGKTTEFTAPKMIFIAAKKKHKLVALEDDTLVFCIHALRDIETGDILDPSMIPVAIDSRKHGLLCD